MKLFTLLFFAFLGATGTTAQVNIAVETKDNALVLQTSNDSSLYITYFGARLKNTSEYREIGGQYRMTDANNSPTNNAYTPAGTWNLLEPALEIEQADGNHSVELKYVNHKVTKVNDNVILSSILLKDAVYPVSVLLNYKVYFNENIIEQWSVIKNEHAKKSIKLIKYASANLYFTSKKYFLKQYHGSWAEEMKPEEHELTSGIKTLDSKLGTRANLFQPPTFSLSFNKPANEDEGEVLLGTLAWTGNFKIDFEKDAYDHVRLIAGINPYASQYTLLSNSSFETPPFIYTYSRKGIGYASRNLHRWARNYKIPAGNGDRQILLNNWEATYFDFDEKKLVNLFKGAKELGVDLFLLDDGWFANKYPRNDDHAGLGDWQENKKKLPNGIPFLVNAAEKQGIKFGIWVEPEMINPKSELYEKHRDWVIRQPNRKEYYFRNQLVLDLTNPQVQKFVYNVLDSLMIKNPKLAFIKWDCNAVIYNAYSDYLQKNNIPQTHLYVEYVKAFYNILEKFRSKYPDVHMMLCSGGGGRVDYGAMKYFTEYWPSDNTDPYERIFIQWENSVFFPSIASCNHVTDWSKSPIKFRTDVAMMGKPGFDIVVDKLSEKDKAFAIDAVKNFKSVKDIIWHGDMYRLVNPWESNSAAVMYVDSAQRNAVVFNYLTNRRYNVNTSADPVKFKGLDPSKKYLVKEINIYPGDNPGINAAFSGDFLMNVGINTGISSSRPSVVLKISQPYTDK